MNISRTVQAQDHPIHALSCIDASGQLDPDCRCYTPGERDKIAEAIKDLNYCKMRLRAKDKLVYQRLQTFDGAESLHWWQEPSAVIGGVVVSFSVGALIGYFATK